MGDAAEDLNDRVELFENPYAKFEDRADVTVPAATLQIYDFINEKYARAQSDTHVNRASAATMCAKRRQYQRKGAVGTPLTPRKLVNFMLGDLVEMSMVYFITEACVGPGKLYSEVDFGTQKSEVQISDKIVKTYSQKTLITLIPIGKSKITLEENDTVTEEILPVTCHADGFGKRNSDGKWELIEVKSAANWGFQSFQNDGPEDYLKQAHTVMSSEECKALGIRETRYFYMRKETGHIWDRLAKFDENIWRQTQQEFIDVLSEEEMDAPFKVIPEMTGRAPNKKTSGRYLAQFPCTYCPYLKTCKGDYTLEWKSDQWGNMKPNYVFEKKVF